MRIVVRCVLALCLVSSSFAADEPKQKPENTIHLELPEPVPPQTFARAATFYVDKVIDRSGNAQPHLVLKARGGVFVDSEPTELMRSALEASLKNGNVLAPSKEAA